MAPAPSPLHQQHAAVVAAVGGMPSDYRAMDDAALLQLARLTAVQQQLVSTSAALIAGEIARRSTPELGSAGLAQRTGHRTPQELVRVTTGSTKREANSAVRAGGLVASPLDLPWLTPLGVALAARALSVEAAEAIRSGLGEPTVDITVMSLRDAVTELIALAPTVDADRLYSLARQHRDAIDEAGIRDREQARRQQRSLRIRRLP